MASIPKLRCQLQLVNDLLKKTSIVSSKAIQTSVRPVSTSSTKHANAVFKMPERIERSPTDILKALDSTVRRDKAGPHYRFHDDPFLTPNSNVEKRIYSLSKESGRKAAQWIKDTNPDLFINFSDVPQIKPFLPVTEYTEESTVTEQTLEQLVYEGKVNDAMTVYRLCSTKGIEVSAATVQSLLELASYTNEEEQESEEWLEERNLNRPQHPGRETQNMWKTEGVADSLFSELSDPSPAAYAAIIRGLAKHNNVDDAWARYSEAINNDVPLDLETYNYLILTAVPKNDAYVERWAIVTDLLESMARHGLTPDLTTLNNCLQVLSCTLGFRKSAPFSLQLLKEMQLQGVTPSLASYFFLLNIICRDRGPTNTLLYSILDELEKEPGTIEVRDVRDTFFFTKAMNVCHNHLKSIDAAHRLQALLEKGQNEKLMGENYKEVVYYRTYMSLAVKSLPLAEFMELYNELVPHIYAAEPDMMEEIVKEVGVQGSFEYLPTLWTDMNSTQLDNSKTVRMTLEVMSQYVPHKSDVSFETAKPGVPRATKPPTAAQTSATKDGVIGNEFTGSVSLAEQMTRIISHMVTKIKAFSEDEQKRSRIEWTSSMLGQMLHVLGECGGSDVGARLLTLVLKDPTLIIGEIAGEDVHKLCKKAKEEKNADAALLCALFCQHYDPAAAKAMGELVANMGNLTAAHRAKLAVAFGKQILIKNTDEKENKTELVLSK